MQLFPPSKGSGFPCRDFMKFVVFHKGITETLAYFSSCIARELEQSGQEVFRFEVKDDTTQLPELLHFLKSGNVTLLTFNFHGIQQEAIFYRVGKNGVLELIWDVYQVRCVNIVVDHPLYYYKRFMELPKHYVQICIDKDHEAYMRKYYPSIELLPAMPLAGSTPWEALQAQRAAADLEKEKTGQQNFMEMTQRNQAKIVQCVDSIMEREAKAMEKQIRDRKYPVVFAGNYTPLETFEPLIIQKGTEYEQFYRGILNEFFACPSLNLNTVFERHIRENIGELSLEEMTQAFHYLMFLDMYVRFYFRGEVVRILTEHEIEVHTFGLGWNLLNTKRPEFLICHGSRDSAGCLDAFAKAKISLNVMPWFKKGAHDRIYSSMQCQAVALTDTSEYLEQVFSKEAKKNKKREEGRKDSLLDEDRLVFYHLEQLEQLPEIVNGLLGEEERMQQIAENGAAYAREHLTWHCFVRKLLSKLL